VDCALWDLQAKQTLRPAWQLAGLDAPQPLVTAYTLGANAPDVMATGARAVADAKLLKLKLTGEAVDQDRIRAVRAARPDALLAVDANQALNRISLEALLPVMTAARVSLIEQPFARGQDAQLDGMKLPIPVAADESAQTLADLPRLVGRYDVVNIKLDKCGGLTEGLAMVRAARKLGLEVMVGNMLGTSLAMAPAFLLGQICSVVDLDGPIFLKNDRANPVQYQGGFIACPDTLWGNG
jgi:L-alanine-DL-glutamate epimerase-like enolase superfamily enzyme